MLWHKQPRQSIVYLIREKNNLQLTVQILHPPLPSKAAACYLDSVKKQKHEYTITPHALAVLAATLLFLVYFSPRAYALEQQAASTNALLTVNAPPLSYYSGNRITGLTVQIVNTLLNRIGESADITLGAYSDIHHRALSEQNTMIFPIARSRNREKAFKWVGPLLSGKISLYARRDAGITIATLDAAKHVQSIATSSGYASETMLKEHGFNNLVSHRSAAQCADSLKYGRVDLWLTSEVTMPSLAQQAGVDPSQFEKVFTVGELPVYIAFSIDTPDSTIAKWQRELDAMRMDGTLDSLKTHWMPQIKQGIMAKGLQDTRPSLTQAEQRWVAEHEGVTFGYDPSFAPLEYLDESGKHTGYANDILKEISKTTGLRFKQFSALDWSTSLKMLRTRQLDIISCIVPTQERKEDILFTQPYASFPSVIVMRTEAPFVSGLRDLSNIRVAIPKDYYLVETIALHYPGISIEQMETPSLALEAVSLGEVEAYIGNLATVGTLIRSLGLTNLKIAARTELETHDFSIGVRNDLPILRNIINKGIAAIPKTRMREIRDRWIGSLHIASAPPSSPQWVPVLAAAVPSLLLAISAFLLLRQKKQLKSLHSKYISCRDLAERNNDFLQSAEFGFFQIHLDDERFTLVNDYFARMFGFESSKHFMGDAPAPSEILPAEDFKQALEEVHKKGRFAPRKTTAALYSGDLLHMEYLGLYASEADLLTGIAWDISDHVKNERALSEHRERLTALMDSIPFFVCFIGNDRRFRMANQAAAASLGTEFDHLKGRHVAEVVAPDVWEQMKPHEDKALTGTPVVVNTPVDYGRRQGSFTVYYTPQIDQFGQIRGVACCIVDMTERQQMEDRLRQSEERYRTLVDNSHDGIVISSAMGRLLYANTRAHEMFGYSPAEAIGMHVEEFFFPEDFPLVRKLIGSSEVKTYQIRMRRKDGSVINVENSRTPVQYQGEPAILINIRDLTDREEVSALIKYNEERLQMALDSTDYGLWELNLTTGKLDLPVKVMCGNFGYQSSELPSSMKELQSIIHPDDRTLTHGLLQSFLKGGAPTFRHEFRISDRKGAWRWTSIYGRIVQRAGNGDSERMLGVMQDITERKTAEGQLRKLATTDSLTSLFNRRYFMDLAKREFVRSKRYGVPLSLMSIDVDHFKNINDTHGHSVGDGVLQAIAQTGLESLRSVDIFGRIGGEEFAVLLPETKEAKAREVAERFRRSIAGIKHPKAHDAEIHCTISIGVAQLEEDKNVESLLKRSDKALYKAKANGRNRVEMS